MSGPSVFHRAFCTVVWMFVAISLSGGVETVPQELREPPRARFITFQEAKTTLDQYSGPGLAGSSLATEPQWDEWIRALDEHVRSRVDRGVEDSISNFILYGVSFTKLLPRLSSSADALDELGAVTAIVKARTHALALALGRPVRNERVEFVKDFLRRRKVPPADFDKYLLANLVRFVSEQQAYQETLQEAGKSRDINDVMSVRGGLYKERGLSADTSLLPNFAIEETLRAMVNKGVLKPESIRRIAIVGPGLDFTDKRDGYDFYPLQTIQPFAILETAKRLGLAVRGPVDVVTLDLNAAVNSHVAELSARARKGKPYTVQLPRDTRATWSDSAIDYWRHFGTILGSQTKPLPVPDALQGLASRAVSIRPQCAARMRPIDLNIVTQTIDVPDGDGFDLVVATNILVYYDLFEQALAMSNIAQMMNPNGMFIANSALPAVHDPRLRYLGRKQVSFANDGSYGDDIVVYQRQ